ncbi:MAG: hypothetical protein KDD36_09240 [Flavobacteriales bacterium]|nr:hypothetical protein [Flavobacteriales bacterium]
MDMLKSIGSNLLKPKTSLSLPLEYKNLKIDHDRITYNGNNYTYDQVEGIKFTGLSHSFNFVPMGKNQQLTIYADGASLFVHSSGTVVSGRKSNRTVMLMYQIVAHLSFKYRLARYAESLITDNSFLYPHVSTGKNRQVRFHSDGHIEKKGVRLDLKDVLANDRMQIGTYGYRSRFPNLVTVYDKGLFSKSISFDINTDPDCFYQFVETFKKKGTFF